MRRRLFRTFGNCPLTTAIDSDRFIKKEMWFCAVQFLLMRGSTFPFLYL